MVENEILRYDEDTCRICMSPESGVININSSINPKFGRIVDMMLYCYDIDMILNDALPFLICNECALHLNVAYNLKMKCLTSEKYFLDYLSGEVDTKKFLIPDAIPPDVQPPDVVQPIETPSSTNPEVPQSTDQDILESDNQNNDNEPNKKYTRPNLMAYFNQNMIIELSDTDSDTDVEEQAEDSNVNKQLPTKCTYECPVCPERFLDLFLFNDHVKKHNKKVCKVCSRICNAGSNLIQHFRTHRPDQKIKCPTCNFSCFSKSAIIVHIRKYHNKEEDQGVSEHQKTMKCNKCALYFANIEEFWIHLTEDHKITVQTRTEASQFMTVVLNPDALKCHFCQRVLKSSASFKIHLKLHKQNKLKYCYICKVSFKHNMSLHFKSCHPGLPPYKCTDHCNETFTSIKLFEAHQRSIKNPKKRSIEPSAEERDTNSNKSARVMDSNVPLPPVGYVYVPLEQRKSFNCYTCDFKADSEALLNQHIDDNHEIKKCKKCQGVFGNVRALAGHFKYKHPTDETKSDYRCKDCGQLFDKIFALKRHQLQHLKKTSNK